MGFFYPLLPASPNEPCFENKIQGWHSTAHARNISALNKAFREYPEDCFVKHMETIGQERLGCRYTMGSRHAKKDKRRIQQAIDKRHSVNERRKP
jgi:hypothetical protein